MDNFEHSSIMGCPKQGNFSAYVPLSQFGSFPEVKNVYQTDCKILKFLKIINIQLDVMCAIHFAFLIAAKENGKHCCEFLFYKHRILVP